MTASRLSKRATSEAHNGTKLVTTSILSAATARPPGRRRRPSRLCDKNGALLAATLSPSALGWIAVAGREELLVTLVFGYPSRERAERVLAERAAAAIDFGGAPPWLRRAAELVERFAAGEAVDFSGLALDLEYLTPFGRRVVAACRNIPRGEVRSYGELAAACGSPGAARAVGSVMAKNRHPLVVPCHRVVGAGGSLGGYSGPDGLRMKRRLLEMEGVLNLAGTPS
jgi:methylated-DNA-[protein]-cysteine S-methyltransferase